MWNFLETFLDPQWSPEVSCKIGSVRPPVWRLCFLGIELLVFSICRHCVRNLCVWQPCSMEKTNCTQNRQKSRCLKLLKNFIISFFWYVLYWKFIFFAVFQHKSQIWENGSRVMGQNTFSQSDCSFFISGMSPGQIDELRWLFLICWYTNSWKLKADWEMFGWT